jgi:hypothetical protein
MIWQAAPAGFKHEKWDLGPHFGLWRGFRDRSLMVAADGFMGEDGRRGCWRVVCLLAW